MHMTAPKIVENEIYSHERLLKTANLLADENSLVFAQQEALDCEHLIDYYLSHLFLQIGIPANKMGYQFLRESVRLVLQEPLLQNRLMHGLYPQVAERFHTTVYCVEHSMRCAIAAAWSRGRPELVEKLLGRGVSSAYEKPTNGELIALVAENLRLFLKKHKL